MEYRATLARGMGLSNEGLIPLGQRDPSNWPMRCSLTYFPWFRLTSPDAFNTSAYHSARPVPRIPSFFRPIDPMPAMMKRYPAFWSVVAFLMLVVVDTTIVQSQSVVRQWNEQLLGSISRDLARPPVHARNLFHSSAAMYDAWAAYVPTAEPYLQGRTRGVYTCAFDGVAIASTPVDIVAAQEEAISFAAYRILLHRFQDSPGFGTSLPLLNGLMDQLGYDRSNTSVDYVAGGPAELGNYIAQEYIAYGFTDGSNEAGNYAHLYYTPSNPPIEVEEPGNPDILDPNLWQQISLTNAIDQSGNPVSGVPDPVGHEWGNVVPFALDPATADEYMRDGGTYRVYHDPGPPALLDTTVASGLDSFYKWNFIMVAIWQSHLDPDDPTVWDISPGASGNVQSYPTDPADYQGFYDFFEGGDPGQGRAVNPTTGQPYAPQLVKRGDYARILAEYWADGPDSVTPPGHWFYIMHQVMDHPMFERRWMGQGPILSDLEYDVKAHFTMGGAMHDAAMTAWSIKGWYDYVRPVSAIRYMGDRGQSSDPLLPNYHPAGLPIIPGYVEQVGAGDPLAGDQNEHVGKMKLYTWRGPEYIEDPETDHAGVGWILAENWWPYQRPSFVTPPFSGYISGHSTYSSAAAQVMEEITGDAFFPGGMSNFYAPQNEFLLFEEGPSEDVFLQWATYRDASDQCSLSRIWGGIHPPMDDIAGRFIGIDVGGDAVDHADGFFTADRPLVESVVVSNDVLNIADIGSTLSVTITYDRDMDITIDPDVQFLAQDPLVEALALSSALWTGDREYTVEYEVLASELRLEDIRMRIDQGTAVGGRIQDVFLIARPFVIDTDRPDVAALENDVVVLNDAVAQSGAIDVLFTFTEACDTGLEPAVSLSGSGDPSGSITYDAAGSAWVDAFQFRARFAVLDADAEIDQVDVAISGVFDRAGNEQVVYEPAVLLAVDTRNPALIDVVVDNATLGLQAVGNGALVVTLEFDEDMDQALVPSLSFPAEDPLLNSLVPEPFNSAWLDATTYRLSYTLLNADEELFFISTALVDFQDAVGNAYAGATLDALFTIDTRRPVVQQTQPSVAVVSDSETGVGGFHIDVAYPEAMDQSQAVLVQLQGPADVASSLTLNIGSSTWVAPDTYRVFFNVLDQGVEVEEVGVNVSFARDLAGNTQTPFTGAAVFGLDTRNPGLLVLTANTYTVTNAFMGPGGFALLSVFDEPMDGTIAPEVGFSQVLDDILSVDPLGTQWLNPSTHRSSYDVANIEASIGAVDVSVSNARDRAGNLVEASSFAPFFSIDLQAVGIGELDNTGDLSMFPNPLSAGQPLQFMVGQDLVEVDIEVFNAFGALVYQEHRGRMARGVHQVALPELATGVHHVRMQVQGMRYTRTLVVQSQ